MHVHPNQFNANLQMEAMYAAQKVAAKREVERTRKKLMESASKLAGECESGEAAVVKLGSREESQEKSLEQQQKPAEPKKQKAAGDADDMEHAISGWA